MISTCKTARESTSSKERRELIAKLGNLLTGNDELLRTLDANTENAAKARRGGGERSKALTWTYVINTHFKLVEGELLSMGNANAVGKKAALTKMGDAVRDVCRLADRRGRHLFDVIDSVFAHLLEVLEKHIDVFGGNYTHLLMDLFAVEAYSNVVVLKQFTDLLQVYVDALVKRTPMPLVSAPARQSAASRARSGAGGELAGMQLCARVIHHLLQCYRADLTPMHKSLAVAFARLLTRIERVAEDEDDDFDNVNASDNVNDEVALQRTAQVQWQRAARAYGMNGRVSLLAAMATVALRCVQSGTESPFWTPRIAALVCHAWPSVRQADHKCTLLRFAHVQLRGAVPFCVAPSLSAAIGAAPLHGVAALRRCFDAELERVVTAVASRRATNAVIWSGCYANAQRSADDEMSRRLLACGADLYLYCEQLHAARPQVLKADVDDRVVKRPRALTPIGELRTRALAGGVAALPWLQLLHAVLLCVGDSALGDCVGRLALSAVVDELCERLKAAPTDDECFWLLACVHRALFASGAQRNSGASAPPTRVSRARCGPRAWSTVVSLFGELGDEAQRGALVVLTTLLEMQLVDVAALDDARLGTVFGVSMFDAQRGRCEREQLRFVLAVLERTALVDTMPKPEAVDGAAAISWRHRLLLWMIAGATFTLPENVSARTAMSAALLVDSFVDVQLWSRVFVSLHTSGVCAAVAVAGDFAAATTTAALDAVSPNAVLLAWRQHELALVDVPWERCSFVGVADASTRAGCVPLTDELFGVDALASTNVRFDGDVDFEKLRATYEDDQVARDMLRTRPLLGVFGARDSPLPSLPTHANAIDHAQRAALADLAKTAFHALVERSLDACRGVLANKRRTLGIDESAFLLQLCHAVHLACAAAVIGGTASPCGAALERDAELLLQFVCDHLGELSAVGSTSDTRLLGRFCASVTQIVALANHCSPLRPSAAVLCDFVHRLMLEVSGYVIGDSVGAVALGTASQVNNNNNNNNSGMAIDDDGGDLDEDFAQQTASTGVSSALTVTSRQHVALLHECLATIGARGADATYEWADGVRWLGDFLARLFDSRKSDAAARFWSLSLSALQAMAQQRAFDTIDGPRDAQSAAVRARCLERLRALLSARRAAPAAMCVRALQQLNEIASDMRTVKDAESVDAKQLSECAAALVDGVLDPAERAGVHVATRRALSVTLQALLRLPMELASFGDVLTAFLEMQSDADIGVRLGVARGITLFFDIYAREREILADIRNHMCAVDPVCACAGECTCVVASPSVMATTLLTLAQVARVSEVNRATLVAEFVLWCSRPAQLGLFARHALTWLAGQLDATPMASAVLAHRAVARLLQRNMPVILDRFIPWPAVPNVVRLDVRTFPFDLCAPGMTMVQFASAYAPELLQRLALANDTEQIERLASTLSLTTQTLLVRHLGAVFGAAMPLYFVREEVPSSDASAVSAANKLARLAAEICEVSLPKLIGGDVSQYVPVQMPFIITTLLDLCHSADVAADADAAPESLVVEVAPGVPRLPLAVVYSAAVIRRGFGYLSESFGSSVSQMLFKGQHSDRVHTTTMHMRYRLARATTSLEQVRVVRALALLDSALENETLFAWTFAELANFYFDALLLSGAARDAAATALLALCRRAASGKLPTLEAQLPRLVANLLSCAPSSSPARACLRFLVVDCEHKMAARIAALEPFVRDTLGSDSKDFDTMMLQLSAVHERVQPESGVGGATASLSTSVAKKRRRESRASAAAVVAAVAQARDPLNDLQRMFVSLLDKIGTDLPDAGALASLRGVANVLEVDPSQLRTLIAAPTTVPVSSASDTRDDGAAATLLERVALRLVAFVSAMSHRGDEMCERFGESMQLAATILGHLRAFNAHAVAFAASATSGADLIAAVDRSTEPMAEYLRLTLIKLTELLQRRDPVLARMSGAALTAVMRTVNGKNALKLLSAAQAELVSPFVVSRASQTWRDEMRKIGVDVDARATRYLRLDGRALPEPCPIAIAAIWSVACGGGSGGSGVSGKSFDEWIRMLTYSLTATHVKDEALSVCAELCLYSSEFAEFCLPAILFDTCLGGASGKEHQKRIARSIVRVALDADSTMMKSADAESRSSAPYNALLACVRNAEFVDAPLNDVADLADESLVDYAPLDDETFTQKTSASVAMQQRERTGSLVASATMADDGAASSGDGSSLLTGGAVARQCLLLLDALSALFRVNLAMLRQTMVRAVNAAAGGSSQSRGRGGSNQVGLWDQVWQSTFWSRIECDRVARCALRYEALCSAVFFDELDRERTFQTPDIHDARVATKMRHDDIKKQHERSIALMTEAFARISEPDALYAVVHERDAFDGSDHALLGAHEGRWASVAAAHDRALLHGAGAAHAPALGDALRRNSELYLLQAYLNGIRGVMHVDNAPQLIELQAECAWRTGRWSYDAVPTAPELRTDFQQLLHGGLVSLVAQDATVFERALRDMRALAARRLSLTSVESTEHVYAQLHRLACVNELERVWRVRSQVQSRATAAIGEMPAVLRTLVERFASDEAALASGHLHQFDAHEPLLSLRTAVLPVLRAPPLTLIERRLAMASLAQQAARPHVAMAELFAHRQLCVEHGVASEVLLRGALTEASVRWQNDDRAGAIGLAQQLVRRLGASDLVRVGNTQSGADDGDSDALPRDVDRMIANLPPSVEHCVLLGDALTLCGRWLGEMHLASGVAVKRHLRCAVAIYQRRAPEGLAGAHLTLAEYVDRRYQALQERIESAAWLASLRLKAAKRAERAQYEKAYAGETDVRQKREIHRSLEALVRQVQLDNDETERVLRERDRALVDAVREYGAALRLQADGRTMQAAFRLASLWFAAQELSGGEVPARTSDAVGEIVSHVPARTFLPLVYQLASRLSQKQADESAKSDGGRFQRALQALLLATATRLPQQSLWTLIALSNGARLPADQRSKSFHVVDKDKVDAAHALLARLRVGDDGARLGAILDEMTQLADAYIDFASVAIPKGADNKLQIDVSGLLLGVPELPRVAVPTLQLEMSEEEERSGVFVYVAGFPTTFRTAGGINVPKIIDCIGADGRLYRQLVKGKDDLRQDMVMQQTFAMCNVLLRSATETRRRCLRIGTYRVVPLTPGAGLLEWCTNTMPLGSWIEGDRGMVGARRRYRPNDMQRSDARNALEQCAPSFRRREFDRICAQYLPVFHYFFLESFASAAEWFSARLAYTRSVAAASIVGNVVGLGDRHSQNILVNVATAELTHIDLGVAFEQGLTLRVPEIVPFRLTREIVDGMGAIGVAGTFTRCCEATASVLKRSQTLILAVLEVLLHDPLYRWALSIDDALALQKAEAADDAGEELEGTLALDAGGAAANAAEPNKDAARALLRCRQKLQCVVGGEVLSVEGYVSQLIAEARDEDRLSRMFCGWAPYS